MIKSKREKVDKKLDEIRTDMSGRASQEKTDADAKRPGSIEVTFIHAAPPRPIRISIDAEPAVDLFGRAWSKVGIEPGQHKLVIETGSTPPERIERVVEVQPASVSRIEVKLAQP